MALTIRMVQKTSLPRNMVAEEVEWGGWRGRLKEGQRLLLCGEGELSWFSRNGIAVMSQLQPLHMNIAMPL